MNNTFKEIIQEICNEEKIKCRFLSKDWVIMLEKNNLTKFICGYKFDLNSHGIGQIADDKYALFEVLNSKKIPVSQHKIVYNPTNKYDYAIGCNSYDYVKNFFKDNNNHIVIKANIGSCGRNVYQVTSEKEIDLTLDKLFKTYSSVSICPFYKIKSEYRLIMLNANVELLYLKQLPLVYGDGIKSIRQLLLDFNYNYFVDKLDDSKYDYVLKKGEEFLYTWKFNLSQGSIAKKVYDKNLIQKLESLAKKICKEINLQFGSIDIIETDMGALLVLEINSGVMIENYLMQYPEDYDVIKNIYRKSINKMFLL